MKKSEAYLTLILILLTGLCIDATWPAPVPEEEPPRLPAAGLCNAGTNHVQEMRFCKGWEKTLHSSKEIRPNETGEPYILVSATVLWDEDSEKLSVMYECYYIMPSLSGLALCVCSTIEVVDAADFSRSQGVQLKRMVEVYYIWAQLAAPVFRGLLDHDDCYRRGIVTTRG